MNRVNKAKGDTKQLVSRFQKAKKSIFGLEEIQNDFAGMDEADVAELETGLGAHAKWGFVKKAIKSVRKVVKRGRKAVSKVVKRGRKFVKRGRDLVKSVRKVVKRGRKAVSKV